MPSYYMNSGYQKNVTNHGYTDRYFEPVDDCGLLEKPTIQHLGLGRTIRTLHGRPVPFPHLLYELLNDAEAHGFIEIVSWKIHGRAFQVYNKQRFEAEIMPRYFKARRYGSFERQLYMYNFALAAAGGSDAGSFFHEYCLRGRPDLLGRITRSPRRRLGHQGQGDRHSGVPVATFTVTGRKSSLSPDFYSMPGCGHSPSLHEAYSVARSSSTGASVVSTRDDGTVNLMVTIPRNATSGSLLDDAMTGLRSSSDLECLFAQMRKFSFDDKCVAEVGYARDDKFFEVL